MAEVKVNAASGSINAQGLIAHQVEWFVSDFGQVLTVGDETVLGGIPEKTRQWNLLHHENFGWSVTIKYEGIEADGDEDDDEFTWEFTPAIAEQPIETHPLIEKLKERFGGTVGDDGRVTFPALLPETAESSGLTDNGEAGTKNPMAGWTSYMQTGGVFTRSYVRLRVPRGLAKKANTVVANLPGDFKDLTPKGRNWMVLMPKISKRGRGRNAAVQISERWMLSPLGGWPPPEVLIDP